MYIKIGVKWVTCGVDTLVRIYRNNLHKQAFVFSATQRSMHFCLPSQESWGSRVVELPFVCPSMCLSVWPLCLFVPYLHPVLYEWSKIEHIRAPYGTCTVAFKCHPKKSVKICTIIGTGPNNKQFIRSGPNNKQILLGLIPILNNIIRSSPNNKEYYWVLSQ